MSTPDKDPAPDRKPNCPSDKLLNNPSESTDRPTLEFIMEADPTPRGQPFPSLPEVKELIEKWGQQIEKAKADRIKEVAERLQITPEIAEAMLKEYKDWRSFELKPIPPSMLDETEAYSPYLDNLWALGQPKVYHPHDRGERITSLILKLALELEKELEPENQEGDGQQ